MNQYPMPNGTSFGKMKLLEIYDYYDGPRLFLASDSNGSRHVAYWCGVADNHDKYYYVEVSESRLSDFKLGAIPIRDLYIEAENYEVNLVRIYKDSTNDDLSTMKSCNLADKSLPPVGDYINIGDDHG